jgi:ribulose-phosphate 3-epimerase
MELPFGRELRPVRGSNLCPVIKPPRIAPSILAADFAKLGEEVAGVEAHVDMLHVDVMDGHFVPNISLGMPVIASLRKVTDLPLDCHLMITNPDRYFEDLAEAGADIVTVHIEVTPDPAAAAQRARDAGLGFGLAANPKTPFSEIVPFIELCDMVLVMSVQPGFGGQSFMEAVLPKVSEARKFVDIRGLSVDVQIDGGIGPSTIGRARAAGADVFVAGSSIFGTPNPVAAIAALRRLLRDEEQNAGTHSRS